MASDIRSFFGGGGGGRPAPSASKSNKGKDEAPTRKKRARKVLEDSDEDEEAPPKPPPKKLKETSAKKKQPQGVEVTSSEYFASSGKPSRSTPVRPKPAPNSSNTSTPKSTRTTKTSTPSTSTRKTTRKKNEKNYAESDSDDVVLLEDEDLGGDDIHANNYGKKNGDPDDYIGEDDLKQLNGAGDESDSDEVLLKKSQKKANPKRGTKRTSADLDDGEDDDDQPVGGKPSKANSKTSPAKPAPKKPRAKATPKKEEREESKAIQDIFDSIPTIRAPTPPPRDSSKKFNFAAMGKHDDAPAAGSADIPTGADDCLSGLSFVFTGVLNTLGRTEGQNLVKQYGGKVTGAPSKNTSYVVLGSDAGPKKLETIQKLSIKTIDENGLFELIRRLPPGGGDGKAAEKAAEKKKKEEANVRAMAEEIDKQEREAQKAKAKTLPTPSSSISNSQSQAREPQKPTFDSRLWVDKYSPSQITQVCGNKGLVEKLQRWLRGWHKSAHFQFKKAGPDGSGLYRTAMIHGPPGIGKTTAAHLVANLEGFDVVETNASDTRSKKLVESGLRGVLDTTSLLGYFSGDGKKVEASKKKLVLIMDEVDGMSAGDRGGVGALAKVAKATSIPMILICNERRLPKMKPFDFITLDFAFKRPTADMIRARLMTICYREGIKISPQVLDALIAGTHADIRQVINMISTAKLDSETMSHENGQAMSKAWEKHVILKPWDIVSQILRPQTFAEKGGLDLNKKTELYFNDHEFSSLMLQENYLKTHCTLASGYNGKEKSLKLLELADQAAESISDGDLVDRMIHGAQQQWSLMPTHAIFSFVRPASFVYGNMYERSNFTAWLGQNSKQGKMSRYIKEIQGHMRLRASGDRHEIRQQYLPTLWLKTVNELQKQGKEAADDVIDMMDSYFLTKEDYDAIIELGLADMDQDKLKIDTAAKSAFTRLYNSRSHPLPFMKASAVTAPKKVGKEKPDLEDAIDESDEGEEIVEGDEGKDEELEGEEALKKDKYIKAPKKKAAGKGGSAGKGKGKKRKAEKNDEDEDDVKDFVVDDEEVEEKPKKGKGRGRPKKA